MKTLFILLTLALGLQEISPTFSCMAQTPPCPAGTHCVQLTWADDANPPATLYNVMRLTGSCPTTPPASTVQNGNVAGFAPVNTSPIAAKMYTDTTVAAAQMYCYVVVAVVSLPGTPGGYAYSPPSGTVSATTPAPVLVAPQTPVVVVQ